MQIRGFPAGLQRYALRDAAAFRRPGGNRSPQLAHDEIVQQLLAAVFTGLDLAGQRIFVQRDINCGIVPGRRFRHRDVCPQVCAFGGWCQSQANVGAWFLLR